jgi:gas vesicle protein
MNNNGGAFVVGVFVGLLAGAAAALLLAPSSGEELRQQLGDKAIELKGTAQETVEENLKKAQQAVQDAQAALGKSAPETDSGQSIQLPA